MKNVHRRQFSKIIAITSIAPLATFTAARAGSTTKEMVDPESAEAKAVKFISQSEDPAQICAGCNFYSSIDDETGSCIILGGLSVPNGAFCDAYQAKKTT